MPTATTICPECNQALRVEVDQVGRRVRCTSCKSVFTCTSFQMGPTATDQQALATQSPKDTTDTSSSLGTSPEPAPTTAKLIGRFQLRRRLGNGAFGVVYLADDPELSRPVALKVPRFSADDARRMKRFATEARAAAKLRHPNIVAVFDAGKAGNQPYIAYEYIAGETLSARIQRDRPDLQTIVHWMQKLADAMAYAHEEGIVHRDLKPDNILLNAKDQPQILDFGLAKQVDDDSSETKEGNLLGTPVYMSPEQARGDIAEVGPLSDQYTLGAIFYELLSGRKPFEGGSHIVIAKVVSEEPPDLATLGLEVSRDLIAICQKAMRKEPDKRYPDCAALAEDFGRYLQGQPIVARPVSRLERLIRWCRREPTLATMVLTVFFAGLVAFGTVGIVLFDAARQGQLTVSFGMLQKQAEETELQRLKNEVNSLRQQSTATQNLLGTTLAEARTTQESLNQQIAALQVENTKLKSDLAAASQQQTTAARAAPAVPSPVAAAPNSGIVIPAQPSVLPPVETRRDIPDDLKQEMARQQSAAHTLPEQVVNTIGIRLRRIPNGYLLSRGISVVTRPFYLGETEVTVGQFRRFVADTRYRTTAEKVGGTVPPGGNTIDRRQISWVNPGFPQTDSHPVTQVSWLDANAFCAWLSREEQETYRLPTWTEWHLACNANTTTRYFYGDDPMRLPEYAWIQSDENPIRSPQATRRLLPNPWGLYDVYGNVGEWVSDFYGTVTPGLLIDPTGPASHERRRHHYCGTTFQMRPDAPVNHLSNAAENTPLFYIGFRVLLELPATP